MVEDVLAPIVKPHRLRVTRLHDDPARRGSGATAENTPSTARRRRHGRHTRRGAGATEEDTPSKAKRWRRG
eukprot:11942412-Heterocapsa_arctica.AAC.1